MAVEPAAEPAPPPPPPGPPKRLFTKRYVVNVRTAPARDAFRIGYLRAGSVFTATTAEPVGFDKCKKGWFEIAETGGFVCNGFDMIAFEGKRLPERRAKQPDLTALLPYGYGFTLRNNTPMYRRLPNDEEAVQYEGYRIPGRAVEPAEGETAVASDGAGEGAGATAGDGPTLAPVVAPVAAGDAASGDPEATAEESVITLADLQGDKGSVLMRRLVKGFYVSLDRDMRSGYRRYWRTQSNGFIPYRNIREITPREFRGVELSREPLPAPIVEVDGAQEGEALAAEPVIAAAAGVRLPIGFVMSSKSFAYPPNAQGKPRRGKAPGYHHMFPIVDHVEVGGTEYEVAADGVFYRSADVTRIDPRELPKGVGEDEHWIDVDLSKQSLVAYEGRTPVYATLISSGRVKDQTDPLQNFATPTGAFRILSKHLTHTMDGDHAVDGPYSIEDVPYVMYFQLAYAIHSAFWHNSFGRPKSHGCINASPYDARWLFNWVTPDLPHSWHAVYPTEERPSTRLYVRGEAPIL